MLKILIKENKLSITQEFSIMRGLRVTVRPILINKQNLTIKPQLISVFLYMTLN